MINYAKLFRASDVTALINAYCAAPMEMDTLAVLADAFEDLGTVESSALARGCRALVLHDLRARRHSLGLYRWYGARELTFRLPTPDDLYTEWINTGSGSCRQDFSRRQSVEEVLTMFAKMPVHRQEHYLTPESVIPNFTRLPVEYTIDAASSLMRDVRKWGAP